MSSIQSEALPVTPLDYARTTDTEWRPIVRGILVGVLIWKGLPVLQWIVQIFISMTVGGPMGLGSSAIFMALATLPFVVVLVGAIGALSFREKSRRLLIVGLYIVAIFHVGQFVVMGVVYASDAKVAGLGLYILTSSLFSCLTNLVPPAVLYWLFTRRVVREMFH